MGTGNITVEFFSTPQAFRVCKNKYLTSTERAICEYLEVPELYRRRGVLYHTRGLGQSQRSPHLTVSRDNLDMM